MLLCSRQCPSISWFVPPIRSQARSSRNGNLLLRPPHAGLLGLQSPRPLPEEAIALFASEVVPAKVPEAEGGARVRGLLTASRTAVTEPPPKPPMDARNHDPHEADPGTDPGQRRVGPEPE